MKIQEVKMRIDSLLIKVLFMAVMCSLVVSSCSSATILDSDVRIKFLSHQKESISRIYEDFTGYESEFLDAEMGQVMSFTYEAAIHEGWLVIELFDPHGATIWQKVLSESDTGNEDIEFKSTGRYRLIISGEETSGRCSVSWNNK
jgi:hypothetical protein